MHRSQLHRAVVGAALVVGIARVASAASPVEVAHDASGWTVKAENAPVEEVLDALAQREGFHVVMQRGVERPPVDVDVRDASLDDVLRRVLSQRNYAIAYRDGDSTLEVSRVELFLPRPPRNAPAAKIPSLGRTIRPTAQRR